MSGDRVFISQLVLNYRAGCFNPGGPVTTSGIITQQISRNSDDSRVGLSKRRAHKAVRNQPTGNDEGLGEGWLVPAGSVRGGG